jgi:hypothetical protein
MGGTLDTQMSGTSIALNGGTYGRNLGTSTLTMHILSRKEPKAHGGTTKRIQSLIVTFYSVVLIAWMCSCCGQLVKMVDWCVRSIRQ